jgi:hypothetical protein
MNNLITGLLSGAALLAGTALAQAQSAPQWVAVPPGFTAVLVPENAAAPTLPPMPDPQAMIAQMNALMAQAQQNADTMQAQFLSMQNNQNGAPAAAGVVITTISDGTHSCTQRITYPGNGGQPAIQLTSTANGCVLNGMGPSAPATPVLLPDITKPAPAAPALIEAQAPAHAMMLADRN